MSNQFELGVAVVSVQIDEAQASASAARAATKAAKIFSDTLNAALGRSNSFDALDKLLAKPRALKIDTPAASKSIDALEGRLRGLGGTNLPPLKIPTPNTKPATDAIEKLARLAADTAKMSIKADIGVNKSLGKDTAELQKQLATTIELERHRRKLGDLAKLKLDSSDLDAAKRSLQDLHEKSLKNIDLKFDAGKAKSSFDGLGKSLGKSLSAGATGAIAGIAASITGTITNAVAAGAKNAVGVIGDRTETRKIDTQSRKIGTLGGDEKESRSLATQVQKDTGFTTSQADILAAMYEVNSSGFSKAADAAQILTASQKAAVAGATELMTVQDAVTSILNSYSMSASDATEVTNQMAGAVNAGKISYEQYSSLIGKITAGAASAGVSLIDLNSVIAIGTANGLKAESAITGTGQAISSIAKPSGEASKLAAKLGIEFNSAALKSKGLVGVLKTIEDAGGGDYGTLLKLFGSVEATAAIMPVFNKGFAALGDISSQISGTNGEDAFKLQLQSMANLEKRSGEIARNIKIQFETSMAPAIEAIMNVVSGVLENLNSAGLFEQLNAGAKTFADTLKDNPEVIKQISDAIASLATEGFTFIADEAKKLTEYLKENPTAIKDTIDSAKVLAETVGGIVGFVVDLAKGFKDAGGGSTALTEIFDDLRVIFGDVNKEGSSFGETLGWCLGVVQDIVDSLGAMFILKTITGIARDLSEATSFQDAVLKRCNESYAAMKGWLDKNQWVSQAIGKVWEFIVGVVKAVLSPFNNVYNIIDQSVQKTGLFKDQWNGMKQTFSNVFGWINEKVIQPIISAKEHLAGLIGMGGNGGDNNANNGPLSSQSNTFKDVVVTSAVDGDGQPGMDYVTEANNGNGGRGAWVPSLTAGKVIEVRNDNRELTDGSGEQGYGNVAIVRTLDEKSGEFVDLLYAHFDKLTVKVGDEVAVGTVLGTQGRTGSTTGAHTSVDFYGKDSNQATAASLAMRDRLANDLASGAGGLNGRIGQREQMGPAMPSSGGGGGSWRKEAWDAYKHQGFSDEAVAALVGAIQQESQGNPNAVGDGGQANGILQWHPDRRDSKYTPGNFRGQLAYSLHEMDTDYTKIKPDLKNNKNLDQSIELVRRWIRPGEFGNRTEYARQALSEFGGSSGGGYSPTQQATQQIKQVTQQATAQAKQVVSKATQPNYPLLQLTVPGGETYKGGTTGGVKSDTSIKQAAEDAKRKQAAEDAYKSAAEAVSKARKRIDTALDQKRLQEDTKRETENQTQLNKFRESRIGLTDSTAIEGSQQSEKLYKLEFDAASDRLKIEREIADLKTARSLKSADLKSKNPNLVDGATDSTTDYSAAIKTKESQLKNISKINAENLRLTNLEQDATNELANRDLDRAQTAQEQVNASNALLRSLKSQKSEIVGVGDEADRQRELIDLDIDSAETLAKFASERLKLEQDITDKTAERGKLPTDSVAYEQLGKAIDGIKLKLTDLQSQANFELKIISDKELKASQDYLENLRKIAEETSRLASTEIENVALSDADRLAGDAQQRYRRNGKYDSQGQNMEAQSIRDKFAIDRDRSRESIRAQTKELNKNGLVRSEGQENQLISNSDLELTRKAEDSLGNIKTLGQEVAGMFVGTFQTALDGLFDGTKSLGQALGDMLGDFSKQLFSLASSNILQSLFGGLLGGGFGLGGTAPIKLSGGFLPTAYNGGIANYAGGGIIDAMNRERVQSGGLQPILAVLNQGEMVIPAKQTSELRKLMGSSIGNFAGGTPGGAAMGNALVNGATSNSPGGLTIAGGITINSSGNEAYDAKKFTDTVRTIWHDEAQRAMRDGGIMAPLQRR